MGVVSAIVFFLCAALGDRAAITSENLALRPSKRLSAVGEAVKAAGQRDLCRGVGRAGAVAHGEQRAVLAIGHRHARSTPNERALHRGAAGIRSADPAESGGDVGGGFVLHLPSLPKLRPRQHERLVLAACHGPPTANWIAAHARVASGLWSAQGFFGPFERS